MTFTAVANPTNTEPGAKCRSRDRQPYTPEPNSSDGVLVVLHQLGSRVVLIALKEIHCL